MKTIQQIKDAYDTYANVIENIPAENFREMELGCITGAADALNWILGADERLAEIFEANIQRAKTQLALVRTIRQLNFTQIAGNPPVMICNTCGKEARAQGWLVAEIPLDDPTDYVCIIACSDKCATDFKAHPLAVRRVDELVTKVNAMRQETSVHG